MTSHPAGDPGYLEHYAVLFADAPASALRVEKTSYYLENEQARERLVRLLPQTKLCSFFASRSPARVVMALLSFADSTPRA